MKIIRTIWGNLEYIKQETSCKAFFPNEVVYVWGLDNEKYLKSLGYDTILVSKLESNPLYNSMKSKYYHKLETIILADEDFGEYLLLDWDTHLGQDVDEHFFNLLRSKSDVQCPLYSLPKNFYSIISEFNLSEDFNNFFQYQSKLIPNYSWGFNNSRVIPNFCFFYSNNAKIGLKLMEIVKTENLYSNVEEFALFKWASCTLDEYIERHEPIVARGQLIDSLPQVQLSLDEINTYIENKVSKQDYIKHK